MGPNAPVTVPAAVETAAAVSKINISPYVQGRSFKRKNALVLCGLTKKRAKNSLYRLSQMCHFCASYTA
jgi:uncharacterized CHY-type Zn-finger protein